MKPLTLKEFSELSKIAYHTLYKYKASYTVNGKVDIEKFTKFIANGGLPRLSNRTEVIESCKLNGLPKLAKLLGQTQQLNLHQLGELSGIAYHTLLSQWAGDITIENFLKLVEDGKWQKIGNRETVRVKAFENSVTDADNKELWLKVAELFQGKKKTMKRKQCRIMLTQSNWKMLEQLAELRHDQSKVNAFVKAIDELSLTFQMGDTGIEATKTWRPKLPLPVIAKMDEIILNHLVHLEPLGKADGHKLVANWAIEAI